ncbi:MAG: tRNA 2-thiocytidine biosynthesis TtcA family protein, partial [Candidatus Bathyarchaeia archaeon]
MRCEICGTGEVFYRRPYEGVRLCKGCFKNSIVDKVRRTISEFRLLKADDHLAVAVSGGKDSLSLLHVLKRLCSKYPRSRLTAIAVDEGIERYREEALTLAKKFCEDSGVPLRALSFKDLYGFTLDELVEERGLKFPCSVCGVLRRRAIAVLAHQVGADKIATAHNLDDEVQTFLLNIFHGGHVQMRRTGPMLTGKGAFLKKVKPFYKLPEKEISLYA